MLASVSREATHLPLPLPRRAILGQLRELFLGLVQDLLEKASKRIMQLISQGCGFPVCASRQAAGVSRLLAHYTALQPVICL